MTRKITLRLTDQDIARLAQLVELINTRRAGRASLTDGGYASITRSALLVSCARHGIAEFLALELRAVGEPSAKKV